MVTDHAHADHGTDPAHAALTPERMVPS
jgi:hypothetical protein